MKKAILFVCGVLWLMAIFQLVKSITQSDDDIVTAFNNEMYLNTESRVTVYSVFREGKLPEDDKKLALNKMAKSLSINKEIDIESEKNDTGEKLYFCIDKDNSSVMVGIEYNEETEKEYLSVDIDIVNSLESGVFYRDVVEKMLEDFEVDGVVYLYLEGDIGGETDYAQKKKIAKQILGNMSGEFISENNTNDSYILYGYTDKISNFINVNGEKININILVSYNKTAKVTEVYMATPVYNEDF